MGRWQPGAELPTCRPMLGVRLFYFCFFLPPSHLSRASSHPALLRPTCTCRLPALQPTDERSWVYSPLHYSAQAHSASDGESDTVSVPTALQPGLLGAESIDPRFPEDRWGNRSGVGGAGLGPYCVVTHGVSILGPLSGPHGIWGPWPEASTVGQAPPGEAQRVGGSSPDPSSPHLPLLPSAVISMQSPTHRNGAHARLAQLGPEHRRCHPAATGCRSPTSSPWRWSLTLRAAT